MGSPLLPLPEFLRSSSWIQWIRGKPGRWVRPRAPKTNLPSSLKIEFDFRLGTAAAAPPCRASWWRRRCGPRGVAGRCRPWRGVALPLLGQVGRRPLRPLIAAWSGSAFTAQRHSGTAFDGKQIDRRDAGLYRVADQKRGEKQKEGKTVWYSQAGIQR